MALGVLETLSESAWTVVASEQSEPWVHRFSALSGDGCECALVVDEVASSLYLTVKRETGAFDQTTREGLTAVRLESDILVCEFGADTGIGVLRVSLVPFLQITSEHLRG
ncbi:MAG: hypothetical protein ACRBK7_12175 [Acidimicrobiales bacterium]